MNTNTNASVGSGGTPFDMFNWTLWEVWKDWKWMKYVKTSLYKGLLYYTNYFINSVF